MKTILSIQSHVAYGYVGNRAAVFPLQRMGYDVIAVNTVQFSNHTGYGEWRGEVFRAEHIADILGGIRARGVSIDALLTGYMGDALIGEIVLKALDGFHIKTYCCDPVMGDTGRGFFVREGIPEFFRDKALPHASILTPNQFELAYLAGHDIKTLEDAQNACKALHGRGAGMVLVTSLEHEGTRDDEIQMLASDPGGAQWIVTTPKLRLDPPPNGAGDCTAALFLGHILGGQRLDQALSLTAASIYGLFDATFKAGSRELQMIAAQNEFVLPAHKFTAIRLD